MTVAAVDIGILNLTHYQTPDPSDYFFGQRKLALEVRDLYGYLIDGMEGVAGALHVGGDGGGNLEGNLPTQAPLALVLRRRQGRRRRQGGDSVRSARLQRRRAHHGVAWTKAQASARPRST